MTVFAVAAGLIVIRVIFKTALLAFFAALFAPIFALVLYVGRRLGVPRAKREAWEATKFPSEPF